MPYHSVKDLPEAQTDQYNAHQKEAFLKAFNNAYDEYGGDEHQRPHDRYGHAFS